VLKRERRHVRNKKGKMLLLLMPPNGEERLKRLNSKKRLRKLNTLGIRSRKLA
jgi:hypothetical protein